MKTCGYRLMLALSIAAMLISTAPAGLGRAHAPRPGEDPPPPAIERITEVTGKKLYLPIAFKGGVPTNHAPNTPASPVPANAAVNQPLAVALGWSGGDPDGDVVTYDVFFEAGDATPDVLVSDNQAALTCNPGALAASATYYWQIVAADEHGLTATGPVWNFSIAAAPPVNHAPNTPASPVPANAAVNQPLAVMLSWTGGDPDADAVTYDVYFEAGDATPDVLASDHQAALSFNPGALAYSTTYYWQIVAADEHGLTMKGPVWRFTTMADPNQAPYTPGIPSPINGAAGQRLWNWLYWIGGDPDGDAVTYDVYFEANNHRPDLLVSEHQSQLSYYSSGLAYNTTYYWRIVATDEHGLSAAGPTWRFTTTAITPDKRAASAALGGSHSCVLTQSGGVKCWGGNNNGQLGDSTFTDRSFPVDVTGLTSGVAAIAAGTNHTCALTEGGGVKCWGDNYSGQLGNDSTVDSNTPVDVSGLGGEITAIAAGATHTCALTSGNGAICWGGNTYGQLGDDSNTSRSTPEYVAGLESGITGISAGFFHTCAVTETRRVLCWGYNTVGQLGDSTTIDSPVPVEVSELSGAVMVGAGGFHTCALIDGGAVKCWGDHTLGQLGSGESYTYSATPVDVAYLGSGVSAIAMGQNHACALTAGGVLCWGYNFYGQLGDSTTTNRNTPVAVEHLGGVETIAKGWNHTCAQIEGGGLQCWGDNEYSQLGDGTTTTRSSPVYAKGFNQGAAGISGGGSHTCALTETGRVRCWGDNHYGKLGDGSNLDQTIPVPVSGLTGVSGIDVGSEHTCAWMDSGGARCWGLNSAGQLGDGTTTDRNTPVPVSGLASTITAIASGGSHTCALIENLGVWCWGKNDFGQLGDGTTTNRTTPVRVSGLSQVTAIAAGYSHTCALTGSGGVKCWGGNDFGQLGSGGASDPSTTPVDVSGLDSGVATITVGNYHSCALTENGGVKCWGSNLDGQLGDGSTTDRNTPVDVSGLDSGVEDISGGSDHTCALMENGGLKCWGWNRAGELGDGTIIQRKAPVDVSGLASGVVLLSTGDAYTCGLTSNGTLKCWGWNFYGQLGEGTTTDRWTPTPVCGFSSQ